MRGLGLVLAATTVMAAPAAAAEVNIWSTSFDTGLFETVGPFPSALVGTVPGGASIQSAGSLPGFGSHFYRNDTTDGTIFYASGLGAHSALRVKFDIVFQDSWDSSSDILFMLIADYLYYEMTVNNASGSEFNVGPGTVVGRANYVGTSAIDTVVSYDFLFSHDEPDFSAIFRGEVGGGTDESWGIDNFALSAIVVDAAVPEPTTWAMLIAGFGMVGAAIRRRRSAIA